MRSFNDEVVFKNEIAELLPRVPWCVSGMSERRHGNLRIGPNGAADVLARARFLIECNISPDRVITPFQTHGATASVVDESYLEGIPEADGLVTKDPNVFLSVTAADCMPVFFVDTDKKIVGIAHAGWRGLLRGVIQATVGAMASIGSDPATLRVVIGPSIHVCHFAVDFKVARQFSAQLGTDVVSRRDDQLSVDLQKSAVRLLGRAGVVPSKIITSDTCTFCEEKYFSHRRDGQNGVGIEAMLAVIGIQE
ncbi:MAG: peptidoglycan editing factor PgeF [bacterium]|nr:peptidoglycan editing factor PgeF [bacterium]